ncbi:MAG: carbonic anhydrase [Actinomycetota bacterium]|nr:carbonic anhydrase [Actinomycetota bacterium]
MPVEPDPGAPSIRWEPSSLPVVPSRHLAVVTCMDSRIDVFAMLGLAAGEAHIVRNAGAIVTDDVLRSLVLSQRKLQTRAIMIIGHTDCGVEGLDVDAFRDELSEAAGQQPEFPLLAFEDVAASVRAGVARLRSSPYLVDATHVTGHVLDVAHGVVRTVDAG